MEKNVMFLRENISDVYENLNVLKENAGYHYIRGEEEEAQKYKELAEFLNNQGDYILR